MSSIFKEISPRPNLGYHGYDVGRRRIFSCSMGQLLPVYKRFMSPFEKVKLNTQTFIRTEAIETSAFIRMRHYAEWFFVPITQIYAFWSEVFFGTQDVMTSFVNPATSNSGNYSLPTCSLFAPLRINGSVSPVVLPSYYFNDDDNFVNDEFGLPKIWNAARLMDLLGYGNTVSNGNYLTAAQINSSIDKWFPVYYLAYHKIFHSHYLNTDYFSNDPLMYNVDAYHGSTIPEDNVNKIMSTIHYRPYPRDYFTSIKPAPVFNSSWANAITGSPLYTNVAAQSLTSDGVTRDSMLYVNDLNAASSNSSLPQHLGLSGVSEQSEIRSVSPVPVVANGVGNLRAMFALDRLLRVTAASGTHYDEQVLAHFGKQMPKGLGNEAYKLGEQTMDIVINEVVATASTSPDLGGGTLGDIAGKGFGSTKPSKDISFEAPCHGVLMCISSISPVVDYASNRVEIDNRYLSTFDFYHNYHYQDQPY